MNAGLSIVADLVESETGIQIKQPQLISLAGALGRVSPGMTAERFLAACGEDRSLLGQLIDQVAIQETYFMREPRELEAIDWPALLSRAHARGDETVKVWVCACASGEEAYSVAMLAAESFGQDPAPVSILATDISYRALDRAQEALYNERSTRQVGATRRERFFTERDRKSAVGKQIRSMISFRRHNLVADPAPPLGEVPFDLILCRNVLIYFGAENVEEVVSSLESALRPGGQLILGASDRLMSSARRFADLAARGQKPARTPGAPDVQRKDARRAPRKPLGRAERTEAPLIARPASGEWTTSDARAAANLGNYSEALDITSAILAVNPLDVEAYFVRGLAELAAGDPHSAARSLRRALYIDPTFALAAFQLARAQDIRGDEQAALRAYRQTLGTLNPRDDRYPHLLERVNTGDIAAACRARLGENTVVGSGGGR